MSSRGDSIISRAARALAADPRLIASALSTCQAQRGISEADLAAWLGLPVSRLSALALCTKPQPADPLYGEAIVTTARYIGCNPERLRQLLDADLPARVK